jgi:hypothetical protein
MVPPSVLLFGNICHYLLICEFNAQIRERRSAIVDDAVFVSNYINSS